MYARSAAAVVNLNNLNLEKTLAGMVEAFDTNYIVGVREEPRLTEQQFGNFQNLATIVNSKAERARFGRFYYRCCHTCIILPCFIAIVL